MKLTSLDRPFWLVFLLLIFRPCTAQAHDPGLSSATIVLGDSRIEVLVGLAIKDAESLSSNNGNPVTLRTSVEFALIKAQLEALTASEFQLRFDDVTAVPEQVNASLKDGQNIDVLLTIAHSISLALATLDIIKLSPRIVEPMIAASIACVGIENLIRGDAPKLRWLITFSFGLVHGLGFADALKEFGIGSGQFGIVLPLVGFNLGVEIGQLSVAAIVLPILWQLWRHPIFVRRWVPACSALVALAGSYWMIERIVQ